MEEQKPQRDDIEVIIIDPLSTEKKIQFKKQQKSLRNPFSHIKNNVKSILNENIHIDDHFKIRIEEKNSKRIIRKRLMEIYPHGSPLFSTNNFMKNKISIHKPSYLHELQYLPLWHYRSLIQPQQINNKGYYQVVIWREGRMLREIIDDFIQFDQQINKPVLDPCLEDQPWIHIILKVWSKLNGGYERLYNCDPFLFVKTFSYPDWQTINPQKQSIQTLISKFGKANKKQLIIIAKTKDQKQVGLYGFLPNCAGYKITGYIQDYAEVYVKIKTYLKSKWNKITSTKNSYFPPEEYQKLEEDEFFMPFVEFLNVFHLIYVTYNKYSQQNEIHYNKFSLNIDACQSQAKLLCFTIKKQTYFNLNTYFPTSKSFDISRFAFQNNEKNIQSFPIVPRCKILIGLEKENSNPEASLVESMVEYMLNIDDDDFLNSQTSVQFDWIYSDYFKGYDNQVTYLLHLKPGRYFLRYKLQQMKSQYRCIINTVCSQNITITDPKMSKEEQNQLLRKILANKARKQKRNITYLNPVKKGSWIIFNDDFDTVGYGSITFHSVRASGHKIVLEIDIKLLKESGYKIKGDTEQNKSIVTCEEGKSQVLVIKRNQRFTGAKIWPPPGIKVLRVPNNS